MKFSDYYETLGVGETATTDEIKSAYRKLARKYHPDVSKEKDAEERFKAVNEAHEVLKDAEKRKAYDQLKRSGFRSGDDFRPPPDFGQGHDFQFGDNDGGGFSEFFESLFGGGGRARRGPTRRGRDLEARLSVTLETAHAGGTQRVTISRRDGPKTLDVRIPSGIANGQTIRLAGQGEPGPAGSGDLLITIEIAPHRLFELDGRDVIVRLPIAPWEAALGATVDVPTLGGRVSLRVPEASQSGRKMRLREKGMPGQPAGDQYVVLEIQTPPASTDTERRFYESMRDAFAAFKPRAALE
ncbi:MAG TPA: DnaJ C-terminal domain-containing protein [Patescibacteria group bacterium]|nr:DnaJ C-terminal domain-containing protein [Patescibacteria group bacterium]